MLLNLLWLRTCARAVAWSLATVISSIIASIWIISNEGYISHVSSCGISCCYLMAAARASSCLASCMSAGGGASRHVKVGSSCKAIKQDCLSSCVPWEPASTAMSLRLSSV